MSDISKLHCVLKFLNENILAEFGGSKIDWKWRQTHGEKNPVGILRCNSEKIKEIKINPTTRKSRGQKMAVQILETLQRKEESKQPNGWLTPNFRTKIFKVPLRDIGDKHEFKVISKHASIPKSRLEIKDNQWHFVFWGGSNSLQFFCNTRKD